MRKLFTLSILLSSAVVFGQSDKPYHYGPFQVDYGYQTKALGDSCGFYFNNYIGLGKTSSAFYEPMRRGNAVETNHYNGRAQRFTTNQPIEVGGVEFYAFKQNTAMDSIMVITSLHQYDVAADSVGVELTRDTVYVSHTAFTPILPNISVKSYFPTPITMTTDYIVAIHTPTDDSLMIITNSFPASDGAGENLAHIRYDNPSLPVWTGWYASFSDFTWNYDYLINPYVKFDLHDEFTILNDSICPGAVGAGCVNYSQMGNFSNYHYAGPNSATPNNNIVWLWGDGFQNTAITSACHTYANPGSYAINLLDTLYRWDYFSPTCVVNVSKTIYVESDVTPNFSWTSAGLTADFTNTSSNSDSVWWDFGDLTPGTDLDNPSHIYAGVGTYDVWLHAYNDCFEDSIMIQVTVDDVGIDTKEAEITIYPNPADQKVVINGLTGGSEVVIINVIGQPVRRLNSNGTQMEINVADLPTGSYFVRISNGDSQLTKKLIVRH